MATKINPTDRFYWDRRLSAELHPVGVAAIFELDVLGFEAFETPDGMVVQQVPAARRAEATAVLRKHGFTPRWRRYSN
ncbi:MAG: hypothetical protein NDI82_05145 [Anaeromyxobacteraceae bacterium]|nr:hypothetical protein [Anaeromyxobacteraceae bacterium]